MLAPDPVRRNVVFPVVLVKAVKSCVCSVKPLAGLLIVNIFVKPEPLLYERTRLVGPALPGLAT